VGLRKEKQMESICFVIAVGLAYFIRALVIKFERDNKIPPCGE
jgi:hypothetical protein